MNEKHVREIATAVLAYLYKHQHRLPTDADTANLTEQLHTLIGCESCERRWEGTTFKLGEKR